MQLIDLKEKLNKNLAITLPLAFTYPHDDQVLFVIKQYIQAIAKQKQLKIVDVDNIRQIEELSAGLFVDDDSLFVLQASAEAPVDPASVADKNLIILYDNPVDSYPCDVITFSKLEKWQIEDYVASQLPGLPADVIKWLCTIAKYDVYRLQNEADKISIFDVKEQEKIFQHINMDNGYMDLNDGDIFTFVNAIMKKDIVSIKRILENINFIDIEGTGVITILLKQFRNLIDIQLNPKATAASLNMSERQFKAISYNTGRFSNKKLQEVYNMLLQCDQKLKNGLLELSNHEISYYIISQILN